MKIQLIAAQKVNRNSFIMEDFLGSDDIFALVREGSFCMESEGKSFTVKKNEGALFKKNTLCHRWVREPIVMYLFRYKSDAHAFDSEHVIFKDQTRLATTFAMLEQLDCEVFREDFEYRSRLFSDLVMQYSMENRQRHSVDEPIERAIAHINRSLHKGTRLARIGEESGLSYVQFLRRFKAFTGVSPSEYITALRLQKAKQMLTDTDLRVKDIASACGFENEYYFSNFFKKHTSISPSAFRASSP